MRGEESSICNGEARGKLLGGAGREKVGDDTKVLALKANNSSADRRKKKGSGEEVWNEREIGIGC